MRPEALGYAPRYRADPPGDAKLYWATAVDMMNVWPGRLVALNPTADAAMTAVGFEPTQLSLVELESTPLDHSGKQSLRPQIIHTLT